MGESTTLDQVIANSDHVFAGKGEVAAVDPDARETIAIARDRFEIGFALEPEHGMFSISVRISPDMSTTTSFGEPPLLDPSEEAVLTKMERVHKWTTLRPQPAARGSRLAARANCVDVCDQADLFAVYLTSERAEEIGGSRTTHADKSGALLDFIEPLRTLNELQQTRR